MFILFSKRFPSVMEDIRMYHPPSILNEGRAEVHGRNIPGTAIPRLMRSVLDTKSLVEFGEPFEGSTALKMPNIEKS